MSGRTGLVVAGAGARGAYEAGALSTLVPRMADDGRTPTVLVGTSAGALNVVGLAGFLGEGLSLSEAVGRLVELWSSVHLDQLADVSGSVVEDGLRFTGQFLGFPTALPSLLDTRRLRETLSRLMPMSGLRDAIDSGPIDAVAVATTSASSGGSVVFVDKKPSVPLPPYDDRRNITYVETQLSVDHVLASAAVPVAFRPVEVPGPAPYGGWYVDGGVRLNVPLKPALMLGCDHLGVVATHPRAWLRPAPAPGDPAPDVFRAASLTLQSLMADRMIEDLATLAKVNRLIGDAPIRADDRLVDFLFAGPPVDDAGALAALAQTVYDARFDGAHGINNLGMWLLGRLIGGTSRDRGELLSFLFFESEFTSAAAALGARHAQTVLNAAPRWLAA